MIVLLSKWKLLRWKNAQSIDSNYSNRLIEIVFFFCLLWQKPKKQHGQWKIRLILLLRLRGAWTKKSVYKLNEILKKKRRRRSRKSDKQTHSNFVRWLRLKIVQAEQVKREMWSKFCISCVMNFLLSPGFRLQCGIWLLFVVHRLCSWISNSLHLFSYVSFVCSDCCFRNCYCVLHIHFCQSTVSLSY